MESQATNRSSCDSVVGAMSGTFSSLPFVDLAVNQQHFMMLKVIVRYRLCKAQVHFGKALFRAKVTLKEVFMKRSYSFGRNTNSFLEGKVASPQFKAGTSLT
ncbi:hypothetical protein NPIL_597691 [Nephila pilipes]|uniref:Uncharacterized protein n=1 Tax=Nephila pilipes TaxID=299642 RepID=A0A8X6IG24_NEPPI|nr:hypothetical protein NPIL_597691 [Nephila pilipes]